MFVFNVLAIESDTFAKSELWIWALISLRDKMQRKTSVIKHTESAHNTIYIHIYICIQLSFNLAMLSSSNL